jgi:hypothetical protein
VSLGAIALDMSLMWRSGTDLIAADFPIAFFVVGCVSTISIYFFSRLPRQAGSEMSGHRWAGAAESDTPAAPEVGSQVRLGNPP